MSEEEKVSEASTDKKNDTKPKNGVAVSQAATDAAREAAARLKAKADANPKAKAKAEPKAKAKVPANAPKARAAKPKSVGEDFTIEVLKAECPKRAGSRAEEVWKLYGKAKTVSKFREAGGDMAYLRFDVKSKFIKLVPIKK